MKFCCTAKEGIGLWSYLIAMFHLSKTTKDAISPTSCVVQGSTARVSTPLVCFLFNTYNTIPCPIIVVREHNFYLLKHFVVLASFMGPAMY